MPAINPQTRIVLIALIGITVGAGAWLIFSSQKPDGPTDAQLKRANISRSTWNASAKVSSLIRGYVPGEPQKFTDKEFATVEEGLQNPAPSVNFMAISALSFLEDEPGQRRAIELMRPFAHKPEHSILISSVFDHYMSTESGKKILTELASGSDPAMALLAKDIFEVRAERQRTLAERKRIYAARKKETEQ